MADRNLVLNTIKEELKDNIKVTNGYSFTPIAVRRGVYAYNDLKGKMPALCFTFVKENPYEDDIYPVTYADIDTKAMSLIFYGYASSNDMIDNEKIFNMVADLETFITSSDFTYNDRLKIDNIEVKEAGPGDLVQSFIMEVRIVVNNDIVQ